VRQTRLINRIAKANLSVQLSRGPHDFPALLFVTGNVFARIKVLLKSGLSATAKFESSVKQSLLALLI